MHQNEENVIVSVIIPTYKRGVEHLSRAVSSVLNQTYANIELIVIDDSPSDYAGREAISQYMHSVQRQHSNVHYLQNEVNMGGSLSRNRGIEIATGDFTTFLDDDDEYRPEKVENQVQYMCHHDCDLIFGNLTIYNDEGKLVDVRNFHDIPSFENGELLKYHLMRHMTGTPTFMYKTEKLREIGGFDDAKMGQEFFLMLKSIERGLKIGYLDSYDVIVHLEKGEAISRGMNKINGENNLYRFKQKYFHLLNGREKRFVRFRHYAVMVVAYLRNSMVFRAVGAGVQAFFSSPLDFFVQVSGHFVKVIFKRAGK